MTIYNELDKKSSSTPVSIKKRITMDNKSAPGLQIMYVDVHEPEYILETLRKEKGIYVEKKHLLSADYAFSNVGIERKTLKDFYNSIVGQDRERLWRQIFNLKRCFDRPLLIIERWNDAFLADKAHRRTVLSALAKVFLLGVPIMILRGMEKDWKIFIDFISYMYFSSDKKTPSLRPVPKKTKKASAREAREDMLCMIPGIGRKTAMEILSRTHDIKSLCALSQEEIMKILPGTIGKKKAEMIWLVLQGEIKGEDSRHKRRKVKKSSRRSQQILFG